MTGEVELRCPQFPSRLFGKMRPDPGSYSQIEVACRDCRRFAAQNGRPVGLVLHLFDTSGSCVATYCVESST